MTPGCIDEGGDSALHVVTTRHVRKTEQAPISEKRRKSGTNGTDTLPEGADPLLLELAGLRETAQRALAAAQRTRNLVATASLLRSANGLLETVAKLEKAKVEEKAKADAAAALPSAVTVEEIERWLDGLRTRLAAQAMQQPQQEKPSGPGVHRRDVRTTGTR